jgi:hypothetical protein
MRVRLQSDGPSGRGVRCHGGRLRCWWRRFIRGLILVSCSLPKGQTVPHVVRAKKVGGSIREIPYYSLELRGDSPIIWLQFPDPALAAHSAYLTVDLRMRFSTAPSGSKMNSVCLVSLLLPLLWRYSVICSSESGPEDDYYTAHLPNGLNYTYNSAKSSNRSCWNKTRAAQEILEAHNEARKELNLPTLVSTCIRKPKFS